jgi:U4/U6.U5 tri-snRNP-associated protein 1
MAQALIRRREEREKAGGAAAPMFEGGDVMTLNDMEEFTRNIAVKTEDDGFSVKPEPSSAGGDHTAARAPIRETVVVEEEVRYGAAAMEEDAHQEGDGMWAPVGGDTTDGEVKAEDSHGDQTQEHPPQQETEQSNGGGAVVTASAFTVERNISRGLGGALDFLKERGELRQAETFAGRTNDTRDPYFSKAMGGFKDVYTGGQQEDRIAAHVEAALTQRDEYGRILTPKEAFRKLCYRFHGIEPSKNTREKRSRQTEKELAQKQAATGGTESVAMGAVKEVQRQTATPYVVLSGNVKPGQSRDANAGYATVDPSDTPWEDEPLPRLGGSDTPLTGRAKVEAMLGMKGGMTSMAPPPPKAPKRG